ncbi:hypothetical protein [Dickeya poaceiphila]|uniref:hypothetical protein n=1 Tax=Dickeya poaceiphila TaxID=568768 RepID=UPI00039FBEDC|nr:hypothetical protein [Dickeya poaceiphila]
MYRDMREKGRHRGDSGATILGDVSDMAEFHGFYPVNAVYNRLPTADVFFYVWLQVVQPFW